MLDVSFMPSRRRTESLVLIGLIGVVAALSAACSPHGDNEQPGDGAAPIATSPVWTADSRGIEVGCSGFFQGSMQFRATRDQLSGAQLALLSQMKRVASASTCWTDVLGCSVSVTNGDGSLSSYTSIQMNSACGVPGDLISDESFAPFRATLPCLYAKGDPVTQSDGGANAPSVSPDVRCLNGLFTSGPETLARSLIVSDPGVLHHLELDDCNNQSRSPGQLHLQVLAADGTTSLAQGMTVSAPGADDTCLRLDYAFPSAGTYHMGIVVDPGFEPGDFFFKFY